MACTDRPRFCSASIKTSCAGHAVRVEIAVDSYTLLPKDGLPDAVNGGVHAGDIQRSAVQPLIGAEEHVGGGGGLDAAIDEELLEDARERVERLTRLGGRGIGQDPAALDGHGWPPAVHWRCGVPSQ